MWECKHNSCSANDVVDQLAVWVRIAGLLVEYYDQKVLTFIGNRIEKNIKVGWNTTTRERGKYVRSCVQVDLSKPLLAMFAIKGMHYKVEYEGLHLLCLSCGKYVHYAEHCPEIRVNELDKEEEDLGINNGECATSNSIQEVIKGPWMKV